MQYWTRSIAIGALALELAGDADAAAARYASALEVDPSAPLPLRALLQRAFDGAPPQA